MESECDPSTGENPRLKTRKTPRQYALSLLGRREWSAAELKARMRQAGFEDAPVDDALAFCLEHGLQSDERFAASRTRMRQRQFGDRRIAHELACKGVSEELVAGALEFAGDELERAWTAAGAFHDKPLDFKSKARLWRFLVSRGFGQDAVKHVSRRLERGDTD